MAIGKNISIFANGVNLAEYLKSFSPQAEREVLDATVLADTAKTYQQGFKNATLSAEGIWDADTTNEDKIHDLFSSAFTNQSDVIITAGLEAAAHGGNAILMNAHETSFSVDLTVGDLIMTSAEMQSQNAIEFGKWLFVGTDDDTGTTGSQLDNGALSSNGGLFHAHLYRESDSAATDGEFILQHSANALAWVDLIAATLIGDDKGSLNIAVAAGTTVNRYLRVTFTATGGKGYAVAAFVRR